MRTSINVVGDSFGAGIVDHLSRTELAELDAAEMQMLRHEEELDFVPPPPILAEMDMDPLKPPELPPRSPRPPKQNHHSHVLSQSHSLTYSPSRSVRSPSPRSISSPSPRSVCSHSPRPFRTHSPRLLRRTEPGYCALPSHDNQVSTFHILFLLTWKTNGGYSRSHIRHLNHAVIEHSLCASQIWQTKNVTSCFFEPKSQSGLCELKLD